MTQLSDEVGRLSERQRTLLELLPRYGRVRWGSGKIERTLAIGAEMFMPSTFNSLVDRGLAWGVDHTYGRISAGRLVDLDEAKGEAPPNVG